MLSLVLRHSTPFPTAWGSGNLVLWSKDSVSLPRMVGVSPGAGARSRASEAMDRYADGEAAAFAEVYDELAPRLMGYLVRFCRSKTDAADLLQQVFLNMHTARGRFARGEKVEPWAYAIARRLAIDASRRNRRSPVAEYDDHVADTAASPEDAVAGEALSRALSEELAALPAAHREAFVLVRVEGLSIAEAAAVLGVSEGAVKVRAHRGGAEVRSRLARLFGRGTSHG